jgi:hypothetical protein
MQRSRKTGQIDAAATTSSRSFPVIWHEGLPPVAYFHCYEQGGTEENIPGICT